MQNGVVYVSAEILALGLSAIGIVLTLGATMLAGSNCCVRRIDALDQRLSSRIDVLAAEIDAVATEVTEVRIAVARLERPQRRFHAPSR